MSFEGNEVQKLLSFFKILIIYSDMEKEKDKKTLKVIQLQDKYTDHYSDYPYVQSCHKDKNVLFTLRSKKTYKYQPILILDSYEKDKLILPLIVGRSIDKCQTCEILKGSFYEDGGWSCEYTLKKPGLVYYQLVFVDYGGTIVKDLGGFDCILQVQNQVQLRKLRKQTVFPRCIGTIKQWQSYFKRQVGLGYNAFHFAPIQQTGYSKSYYSIYDHFLLASDIFKGTKQERYEQLQHILSKFRKEEVIFFIDIVLNHTSFDSEWIKEDSNSVFTLKNTPMLQSAYELDIALRNWGTDIKQSFGDAEVVMDNDQYEQVKNQLTQLVEQLNLSEFFEIDEKIGDEFLASLPPRPPSENIFAKDPSQLIMEFLQQNCTGLGQVRKGVTVKNLAQKWKLANIAYEAVDVKFGIKKFNSKWKKIIKNEWQHQIINNLLGEIKYNYLDNHFRSYDDPLPFINPYFSLVQTTNGQVVPALNNGWVMGADTSQNLVTTKNFYYLRRRVSVWGDLIRIRYGDSPGDSPAWQYMKRYVQTMAKYFDGFRLDNLHGTQLNVARWMIKQARKVKPQIIIFAELFTSTQREKAIFCRTSGVNSTLFEIKHHLNGNRFLELFYESMGTQGKYTGSISPHFERPDGFRIKYCKRKKPIPLIYDLTHDNKTYEQSGCTVRKTPICIICEFSGAFVGSTKGFDQFYSKKILVTQTNAIYLQDQEKKVTKHTFNTSKRKIICTQTSNTFDKVELLGSWNGWNRSAIMQRKGNIGYQVDLELPPGTYEFKFKINDNWENDHKKFINKNGNHQFTIKEKDQRYLHKNLEQLRKKGSESRQKYFAYNEYFAYCEGDIIILLREKKHTRQSVCIIVNLSNDYQCFNGPIKLPGKMINSDIWIQAEYNLYQGQTTDVQIINHINLGEYFDCYYSEEEQKDILIANGIPPGFGCIIQCRKTEMTAQAIKSIRQMRDFDVKLPPMGPLDYNLIMYGVQEEEKARFNSTNYYLPSEKRKLIFGGFGGIIAQLQRAKRNNLLSIGLFDSIRQGHWLLDYYVGRLKKYKNLTQFTDIVQRYFECLKLVPAYLRPKYFTDYIYKIYKLLQEQICQGSTNRFERKLMLATTQFISSFDTQNPLFRVTISAGLPHFAIGWTRCWGRDTFMCNEILLHYPNIYRDVIIQFASTLRHGMIPNLLDFGKNPRYNCRDACWWFIRGVKQYARSTKDYTIFKTKVNMLFLSSDQIQHKQKLKRNQKRIMLIQEIIQNIFQSHAYGISYREWNAGYQIDSNMNAEGFTVQLSVDQETGFIVGGNSHNCLTWMDKMGSSGRAGNKGFPATPRAGAPVQLTALLYHCLVEYDKLHKEGHYSFNNVKFEQVDISYDYWANRIKQNFEPMYFIDEKSQKTKYQHIYKDVVMSPPSLYYQEFRLRPNALVALALAPELMEPEHAKMYLKVVEKELIHEFSIGVSTLGDAHDSLFVPYYDNSNDSTQVKLAQGFSYHNGPQWVWLYGFYVVAKCNFNKNLKRNQFMALLQTQARYLYSNDWGSLPELTNKNGQINSFSCQSQAWSISSMLLGLNAISKLAAE